jgi:hypothetical protein
MKIIKLNYPPVGWPLSDQKDPYIRQTPGNSGIWGDYQFFVNTSIEECDYWVVFEQIDKTQSCNCPHNNTIFITGEPPSLKKYNQKFLSQFSHIISCHKSITHPGLFKYIQGHLWFVGKNYDELSSIKHIEKTKEISIITSNKIFSEGHKKRYEFALKLKEHFGNRIDLFGNGIRKFEDKWDVLAPYKYSVIIENYQYENWLTEKLFDCYLTHTFPLYFGCSNISDYYNENAYIKIDLEDIEGTIQNIEKILSDKSHYEKSLSYLLESKDLTLNRYNLFPLIVQFIELKKLSPDDIKINITINPEPLGCKKMLFDQWKLLKSFVSGVKKHE